MSREATKPRPSAGEPSQRKQSGTRRILVDDSGDDARSSSVELIGSWPADSDQDLIPTQPATEPPSPPSQPPLQERTSLTLELPPPSYEEVRDTIPAPPPDHAD